jgi:hypothetical protein
VRKELAVVLTLTAVVLSPIQSQAIASPAAPLVGPASNADLGNCLLPPDNFSPHQGGYDSALVSNSRGLNSLVYAKNPDLCNGQSGGDSGSLAYIMLTREFDQAPSGRWYQIGNIKRPGDLCPHWFMQYNPGNNGALTTDYATSCSVDKTWYRLKIRQTDAVDDYWASWVQLVSNGSTQWSAPRDPTSLAWSPEDAELSSEVLNAGHDQSGGGNTSRLTFDGAYWWTNTYTVVNVDIQGAERICHLCGGTGPYNYNWYDGNTFEVWTDGF